MKHIAFIMDGNRRWAKKNGMIPWIGHTYGFNAAKRVISYCLEKKIPYLSLYVFSLENYKRTKKEKDVIFHHAASLMSTFTETLVFSGVKARFFGDRTLFPKTINNYITKIEEKTKNGTKLFLQLLFCYGGQQEIIAATKKIAYDIKNNNLKPEEITKQTFIDRMWTADIPFPDIIVRTGKQKRLSNFLLFQAAYAEIFFLDILWPDINYSHLDTIYNEFKLIKRNFGK